MIVLNLIDELNNVWLLRKAWINLVMAPLHQRILWSYQIVVAQLSSQSASAKPITNLISATDRQADRRIIRANTCEWQESIIKHPDLSLLVMSFKRVTKYSNTNYGLFKIPKFDSPVTSYVLLATLRFISPHFIGFSCHCLNKLDGSWTLVMLFYKWKSMSQCNGVYGISALVTQNCSYFIPMDTEW